MKKVEDKVDGIENETAPQRQIENGLISNSIEELVVALDAAAKEDEPEEKRRPWHLIGGYNFCYKGVVPKNSIFSHFEIIPTKPEFPTFTMVAWQGFPGEEVDQEQEGS